MRELDSIAVVGAGRLGTALAAALRAAGLSVSRPAGPRARRSTAPRSCCCACPDGEIAAAAAAVAAGPLVGHCSGATDARAARAATRRSRLHPLMTVPAGSPPEVFARRGGRRRRLHAARAGRRRGARAAARDAPDARGARGPRRLPRGRLDRLELPRHARGRRGAARGHGGRGPRGARPARARRGRDLGRARRRAGADRPDRARRRGAPSRASARRCWSARRSWRRCSTRWSTPRARSPARRCRRDHDPHQGRDARPHGRARAPPGAASGSCRRWAPSTPATTR